MDNYIHLDLFSGIGGFALAARNAGWTFAHSYHSDIEPFPLKVYEKHFPESISLGNIKEIDGYKLKQQHPNCKWLITAGFPCQNISNGGQKEGIYGDRSSLWFEVRRLVSEISPEWLVLENVEIIRSRGGLQVITDLASMGYASEWGVIPAWWSGVPQRRHRWLCCAYPNCSPLATNRLLPSCGTNLVEMFKPWQSSNGGTVFSDLQGETTIQQYQSSSKLCRISDGFPAGMDLPLMDKKEVVDRIRALGNSIVPGAVEPILRRMRELTYPSQ